MGCAALFYNKPDIRKTWDNHAVKGYYVKSSREDYRCYKIYESLTQCFQTQIHHNARNKQEKCCCSGSNSSNKTFYKEKYW